MSSNCYCRRISASCDIRVGTKAVTNIELNLSSKSLNIGEMFALRAYITPDDAADLSVAWESSDTKVAKITDAGIVTAYSAGKCTISATSGDQTAECKGHSKR